MVSRELSHTGSRITNCTIPEMQAWNRQKFNSEKHNSELNRTKPESQKSDLALPIRVTTYQCLKLLHSDLGIARFETYDVESSNSRFRIADSMPLRLGKVVFFRDGFERRCFYDLQTLWCVRMGVAVLA